MYFDLWMRTKRTMKPFQDISEHEGFIFFIASWIYLHLVIMKFLPTANIAETNTSLRNIQVKCRPGKKPTLVQTPKKANQNDAEQ